MDEINEPAPPSDRGEAMIDRMKTHLKNLPCYSVTEAENIAHLIEEINVISGDDSVVELTNKILQCIAELDTQIWFKNMLSWILEETIEELYPELWVIQVPNMGIVIADSVWESKFAPKVDSPFRKFDTRVKLQRYLNIYLDPMQMVKNLEKRLQVYTDIDLERCFVKRPENEMISKPEKELHQKLKKCKEEKENCRSHPPNHVVKIDDNGVLKVDKGKTKRWNTFLNFYGNRLFQSHSTDANRLTTWAALYGMQWAQLSVLGNPLDKLSQSRGIDPMELSMGKACSITVWASIFFLNFIFAGMLTLSLPHRIPAYSMLGFNLLYYILAIIVAVSGYSVSWGGSAKMSGLLFVFGGATSLMLLLSIIIIGVLYASCIWCSYPKDVGGEVNEKHSPECMINIQDT